MIVYKNSDKKYIPQLKKMWQNIFLDEMDYINLFFDNMYKDEYAFIAVEDEKVLGMMFFLPATMVKKDRKIKGRYVYAVATDENQRGRGIMTNLEQYAANIVKNDGVQFLTLVPASESLFNMYEKLGYKTYEYHKNFEYKPKVICDDKDIKVEEVSIDSIYDLRQKYLDTFDEYIILDDYDYAKKELAFLGIRVFVAEHENEKRYILSFINDNTLTVKETSLSDELLKLSLCSLAKYTKCENFMLKLSQKSFKSINKTPYSMVKYIDNNLEKENIGNVFQNLMLD